MAGQGDTIGLEIGRIYFQNFSDNFFKRVLVNKAEIEEKLEEKFELFFYHMATLTGDESTPGPVASQGVRWAPNTEKWRDQKARKGASPDPNRNLFYQGITKGGNSFRSQISRVDPVQAYGGPEISVGSVKGEIISSPRGLSRIKINGNILRLDGRFASVDQVFNAKISLKSFGKVRNRGDWTRPFGSRVAAIIGQNEGFGSSRPRPRRPFLVPFAKYYAEVVLVDEFRRVGTKV